MSRGFVTSSKYSPGNMTAEALARTFVARDDLMNDALKRIVKSTKGGERHFMLLVGPRGIGKTHFVSLLYNKLLGEPAYEKARQKLCIAFLNEEESIASFLDLLVRVLHALTRESDGQGLQEKIEQIYRRYAENPDDAISLAERTLKEHVGKRTLLVICENFSTLLEGLEREGQQRWRAFMQENPFWDVLATTTEVTEDISAHDAPFFGSFTIEPLEKLSFDEALQLLKRKAELEGKPRIAELLVTPEGRARVRAIHHLADGNFRVYVVMFPFLNEESLNDIAPAFLELVDEMTPYYQERMARVSPVQRKILEYLSEKRIPTAVKDIALGCLSSPQTISKQVGELAYIGYVKGNRVGRETLYELNEPLMRICFEVKDRRSEYLKAFVDLLRGWYSKKELTEKLAILENNNFLSIFDVRHVRAAIEASRNDGVDRFLASLTNEAERLISAGDLDGSIAAMRKVATEDPTNEMLVGLLLMLALVRRTQEAESVLATAPPEFQRTFPWGPQLISLVASPSFLAALSITSVRMHPLSQMPLIPKSKDMSRLWFFRTIWLAASGRYEEARMASLTAVELGEPDVDVALGFSAAASLRGDAIVGIGHLHAVGTSDSQLIKHLAETAGFSMFIGGPAAFAQYARATRSILDPKHHIAMIGTLLTPLLRGTSHPWPLTHPDWLPSLPAIHDAFQGLPSADMPLQMLDAAVHNAAGDDTALLKLPLELRKLLTDDVDHDSLTQALFKAADST